MKQITQAVLLRTLSEKSTLKFGKYPDIPIFKLLESNSGKSYLMYLYYNASMISFSSSILDGLHIIQEDRIIKPGTDSELFKKKKKSIEKMCYARGGVKHIIQRRTAAKKKLIRFAKSIYQSKSQLREKNRS